MFSYGEGNILNFENLQDVCGLFAANTSGKSSLLDAITYTIFDKCSKTGKANEVLNNKKAWFRGVFKFEMNGTTYTIERRGTQNKKKETHVKVDVDFYTDSENLNGEERGRMIFRAWHEDQGKAQDAVVRALENTINAFNQGSYTKAA